MSKSKRPVFIARRSRRAVFATADILRHLRIPPESVELRFTGAPHVRLEHLYESRIGVPVDDWPAGTPFVYIGLRLARSGEDRMSTILRRHKELGHELAGLCTWCDPQFPQSGNWDHVFTDALVDHEDFVDFCVTAPEAHNPYHALNIAFNDQYEADEWSRQLRELANLSPEDANNNPYTAAVADIVNSFKVAYAPGVFAHLVRLLIDCRYPHHDQKVQQWREGIVRTGA